MKLINLEQNTDEWKEFRRSHLGASDLAILMDGSKAEIYDLYLNKMCGEEKFVTDSMQRGKEMENEARCFFNICCGYDMEPAVGVRTECDWIMASFDGYDPEANAILEIKCPREVFEKIEEHPRFKRWWWQVQAQLAVSEAKKAFLLAYSPSKQVWGCVERDEDAISDLMRSGDGFYARMMNYDPPEESTPERSDSAALDSVRDWKQAKEKLKLAEEEESEARKRVISVAGGQSFACDGILVKKIYKQGNVDYRAIPELKGVDLNKFRKGGSEYWRLG